MKAIEVTEDNFEALLAYDDLFLDYFNAFLQLPAFPQPLYYNRLTGTFQEVENPPAPTASECGDPPPAQFAPSEEERERIIEWAKKDRLPLFLRTKLFLEYKLCKLLIRALEERSASRQSSHSIHGYSRQTTSYATSSLGNSHARSTTYDDGDSEASMPWTRDVSRSALLGRYLRPGSRAQSVPPNVGLSKHITANNASYNSSSGHYTSTGESRRAKSGSAAHTPDEALDDPIPSATEGTWMPMTDSGVGTTGAEQQTREGTQFTTETTSGKKSSLKPPNSRSSTRKQALIRVPQVDDPASNPSSAKQSDGEVKKNVEVDLPNEILDPEYPINSELRDQVFGDMEVAPSFVEFDDPDEYISDVQTEADLREIETRHKRTFQQLKEELLGSIIGMDSFKEFLYSTIGMDMLNFWLDCEHYCDNVRAIDTLQSKLQRNRLFRDIQDRYKFKLSEDAKDHIKQAQENEGLSETVFTKTQYDILRRMRTYWVPRFLIHQERQGEFDLMPIPEVPEPEQELEDDKKYSNFNFLPSISLVNSLPVRPESCVRLAQNNYSWDAVVSGGHKMEEEIRPGKFTVPTPKDERPYTVRFREGIMNDKDAGGPFQRYLESQEDNRYLSNFLFWQDVTDYGQGDDRSADRLLRMGQAWTIFNKYISLGCVWDIGLSPYDRDNIHHKLLTTKDFVEAVVFDGAKDHTVKMLQREWLRYLKYDLRTFLECRARPDDMIFSPSPTPPPDSSKRKAARKPWVRRKVTFKFPATELSCPGSTESQRQQRLLKSLEDAEKINAIRSPELMKKKQEKEKRKKQQAVARKKLLKKMKKGGKMGGKKGGGQVTIKTPGEESGEGDKKEQKSEEKKKEDKKDEPISFSSTYRNRTLMNSFKKFLSDDEEKEYLNSLNMYLDIETYQRLPEAHIEKKQAQLKHIVAAYFTQTSKKFVNLPAEVVQVLAKEGDRPRNSVLNACQKAVKPDLEQQFQLYWSVHLESLEAQGISGDDAGAVSKIELAMKSENTSTLMQEWKRRRRARGPTSDPTSDIQPQLDLSPPPQPQSSTLPPVPETPSLLLQAVPSSNQNESISDSPPSPVAATPSSDFLKKVDKIAKRNRKKRYKQPGKSQPTNQDKTDFIQELMIASRGEKPLRLRYFQKYLATHGENDNLPLLPNDLDFWLEVQRFKDGHHAYSDQVLLKKKVEVIVDCFLDSQATTPSVQIDIPSDVAAKLIRYGENYIRDRGKDPHNPTLFDEAQLTVFREMLPYWAGFVRQFDNKKLDREPSVSKTQKLTQERLKAFLDMEEPNTIFRLPSVNPTGKSGATIITFSISDGLQWKELESGSGDNRSSMATPAVGVSSRRGSMMDSRRPGGAAGRISAVSSDGSASTSTRQRQQRTSADTPKISITTAAQ
ncbi:uncharacterized protein LOC144451207 isoform X2 [Glandiceps talaboti]